MLQVNPPIRQTKENRLAMINFLKNGQIDFWATDHAPHSLEEKTKGMSGIPHLDTYGSFVTCLVKEHDFIPIEIARVSSLNPGNFLNKFVAATYGKIEVGLVASFTILGMDQEIKITKEILKTKSGWSPFEGVTFPGRVVMTIVKGKVYEIKK